MVVSGRLHPRHLVFDPWESGLRWQVAPHLWSDQLSDNHLRRMACDQGEARDHTPALKIVKLAEGSSPCPHICKCPLPMAKLVLPW